MAEQDEEGFLGRWARRKQTTSDTAADVEQPSAGAAVPGVDSPPPAEEGDADSRPLTPEEVEALPDIDELDADSDFTVFLREGVPDALRRRALSRLWRLNPVFSHLDGLNDYDDDFNDIKLVGDAVQTIYKAGRGYFAAEDKKTPVRPSEDNPLPAWEVAEVEAEADTEAAAETAAVEPEAPDDSENPGAVERDENATAPARSCGPAEVVGADEATRPGEAATVAEVPADAAPPSAARAEVPRKSESADSLAAPVRRSAGDAMRRRWGRFQG